MSQIVEGIFFTSEVFQQNGVERCYKYENTKNGDIRTTVVWLRRVHPTAESSYAMCIPPLSQATRCASHCGVKLRGVHHTRSQTALGGVKIEIIVSLWLLLKGQSSEILLGVNTSTMKEKIWSQFFLFA